MVQAFGKTEPHERLHALVPPDTKAPNYMFYKGGTLRFGRLLMLDAEMQIVDLDPEDVFRFDLSRYNEQLVAGYERTLADGGLEVWMRDVDKLECGGAHAREAGAALTATAPISLAMPSSLSHRAGAGSAIHPTRSESRMSRRTIARIIAVVLLSYAMAFLFVSVDKSDMSGYRSLTHEALLAKLAETTKRTSAPALALDCSSLDLRWQSWKRWRSRSRRA